MGGMMDWYNQNQFGLTGGSIGGLYGNSNNFYPQHQQQMMQQGGLSNYLNVPLAAVPVLTTPAQKVWKKTNNFLVDLRHEISEWHGDILRAA